MTKERILVTYASKHGATAEIAEGIGAVLLKRGMEVDVMAIDRASDLAGYAAIVLGVALYMGNWRKEAVRFLKQNEAELSGKPFWLFLSGPSGVGDPIELLKGRQVPPSLQGLLDRIKPREVTVFHGALTPEKISGFERWIIKRVKAATGDFRDWSAIESWATSVAAGFVPQA
ncbi:MAG TPA: flavodoxin domain-containing protein [Spirochaetia bacterium]|nr:flavodoxin domain-containing protein [Spirochaetia bacterium]